MQPLPDPLLAVIDECQAHNRITGCQIRLKHVWLTVVVVYLVSGDGLSVRNLSIINTLRMMVMGVPGPVILMGDFNLIAEELFEGALVGGGTVGPDLR